MLQPRPGRFWLPLTPVKPAAPALFSLFLTLALLASCLQTGYVIQAGIGQLELVAAARDIDDVLADPDTDPRTRALLSEVAPVLAFAEKNHLPSKGNYRKFVDLDRRAAVWFMATSKELSFEPKVWRFPIVGSFTYLGWFSRREAEGVRENLEREGWDVHVRSARAYSTGGWFRDPVLASMFSDHQDALRDLVNTLLHELTHANILVRDQSTFNESIASFVGDTMAEQYLIGRFGIDSGEVALYRQEHVTRGERGAVMAKAYAELDALYKSDVSDDAKRARKKEILDQLELEAELYFRPNNASLIGFKTYNAGMEELAVLYSSCQKDWQRFFAVIKTLRSDSFGKPQDEDIGPGILALVPACQRAAGNQGNP